MQAYLDLLKDILDNGVRKSNRTGVDTLSVVGRQLRFDLRKGFPMVTTRPIYIRGVVEELLFFIRGATNNEELTQRNVHIWDKWALEEDHVIQRPLPDYKRANLLAEKLSGTPEYPNADNVITELNRLGREAGLKWINENNIPETESVVDHEKGSLGPIYGFLWRHWRTSTGQFIDQLAQAIELLKTNPYSRRILVSSWNPEVLPDETKSPQENVIDGKQCLAACHTFFQLLVTPSSGEAVANDDGELVVPNGTLNLLLYQRSADGPIGLPYNFASYALLLAMIAQVVGLEAGELIWTGADAHIYEDQIEGVKEQLSREPLPLPSLWLNPEITDINDFTAADIRIDGYASVKPQIKYPVAV